jgi:ATP-dependent Lhr-like helicase
MGAVDLVCQVESPGNVARGLQRVGRAGHVVHGVSRGRLIAKTPADLLESAALCRAMIQGRIEHLRVPKGCLDVLAQQVVACVAMDAWTVPALFNLVRGAEPFHEVSAAAFESVLRLVSGRFPTPGLRDLRARIAWDPIHHRLAPLPGTAHLALVGGGTIPDTGQFPVYLGDGGPRLGELDEEFVYERRVGETFILGNSAWRIDAIEPHRLLVTVPRPAASPGGCRPRRSHHPDRELPRSGRRARPGRALTLRGQAAPGVEAGSDRADPPAARPDPGLLARRRRVVVPPAEPR